MTALQVQKVLTEHVNHAIRKAAETKPGTFEQAYPLGRAVAYAFALYLLNQILEELDATDDRPKANHHTAYGHPVS